MFGISNEEDFQRFHRENLAKIAEITGHLFSKDIMEVFSPKRVAALCAQFGLFPRLLFRSNSWL